MCSPNRFDRSTRLRIAGASLATSSAPLLLFRHHLHNSLPDSLLGFALGATLGVSIALMLGGAVCRLRGQR